MVKGSLAKAGLFTYKCNINSELEFENEIESEVDGVKKIEKEKGKIRFVTIEVDGEQPPVYVSIREPNQLQYDLIQKTQSKKKDESSIPDEIKNIFENCIINIELENDDGTPYTHAQTISAIKEFGGLYFYLVKNWIESLPLMKANRQTVGKLRD